MPKEPPQKSKQQQEREAAKDLDEDVITFILYQMDHALLHT